MQGEGAGAQRAWSDVRPVRRSRPSRGSTSRGRRRPARRTPWARRTGRACPGECKPTATARSAREPACARWSRGSRQLSFRRLKGSPCRTPAQPTLQSRRHEVGAWWARRGPAAAGERGTATAEATAGMNELQRDIRDVNVNVDVNVNADADADADDFSNSGSPQVDIQTCSASSASTSVNARFASRARHSPRRAHAARPRGSR
jgi:hypothetical protein